MPSEVISLEIEAILTKYTSNMSRAINLGRDMDMTLDRIVTSADRAEKALNALSGKFTLNVDYSVLSRITSDLDAISGMTPDIFIDADESDLNRIQKDIKALDGMSATIPVKTLDNELNLSINKVDDLDASTATVDVKTDDQELDAAADMVAALDGDDINLKVKVDNAQTEALKKELDDLEQLARIDLALNIGSKVVGGAQGLAGAVTGLPIFSDIASLDKALDNLRAKTGKVIPDAASIIEDVWSGAWGESREEIASVVGAIAQVSEDGTDLAAATVSTFETAQVTGYDFAETISAQSQLVKNGLAPDFEAAGDTIVRAYQLGGDRAQDLLDTLREYAPVFKANGLDGVESVNLIVNALNSGAFNADKVGDSFKELGIIIQDTLTAGEGEQFDVLTKFGMTDEAELLAAGELSGTQFAEAFNAAVQEKVDAGEIDPAEARTAFTSIFGTPLEDLGIDVFQGIDFAEPSEEFRASFEDASTEAANAMNDNLGTAVTELSRTIEGSVIKSLEDAGVRIDDLFQGAIDKLKIAAELIRSGAGIPEALEIALEAPGLADTIRRVESVFGNLVLELLTGLANLISILPGTEGAQGQIRSTVADFAGRQFAFDVALDPENMSHIESSVQTALRRGVDGAEIGEQLARSAQDLIDRGDLEAAQQLLTTVEAIPAAYAKFTASARGDGKIEDVIIPLSPDIVDDPAAIQAKIDAKLAEMGTEGGYLRSGVDIELKPTVDTEALQGLVTGAMSDAGVTIEGELDNALSALDEFFGVVREREPIIPESETVAMAASALSIDSVAHALEAVNSAGWPITEADLQALADADLEYDALIGVLNDYETGLADAQGTTEEVFEAIRATGIDPTIEQTELLNEETGGYVLALVDTLEKSKVTWEDYKTYLAGLDLPTPEGGIPAGTQPNQDGAAAGGIREPGAYMVGELGPELVTSDTRHVIINDSATTAILDGLATVLSGGLLNGGGGDVTNNINLTQNVYPASGAAGAQASDQFIRTQMGYTSL